VMVVNDSTIPGGKRYVLREEALQNIFAAIRQALGITGNETPDFSKPEPQKQKRVLATPYVKPGSPRPGTRPVVR